MEREINDIVRTLKDFPVCNICKKNVIPKEFKKELEKYCIDDLKNFVFSSIEAHHTHYEKDIKIDICAKCHKKIHSSKNPEFDKYKPVDKREDAKKTKKRLVPCSNNNCSKKTLVLREGYNEYEENYCYKCRKKIKRTFRKKNYSTIDKSTASGQWMKKRDYL